MKKNIKDIGNKNNQLQTLFEKVSVALAIFKGKDLIIEVANAKMCAFWGKTKEQILGKPLSVALPEIRGQGFLEIMGTVMKTGVTFIGKELPAKIIYDGKLEERYFDFINDAIYNIDGSVRGLVLTATDSTERVMERKKVEVSENRYRTLFSRS